MKYIFLLLLALFLCADVFGQALDALPSIDQPQPNDRIHTYTRGFSAAFRLDTLKAYFTDGITGGASADTFSLRDPVLRVMTTGTTVGGNSFSDWVSWHYFTPPTMSLSGSSPTNEVGTSNAYTYGSTTSNPGIATLSGGRIELSNSSVATFGSATTGSYTYTFAPTSVTTLTMRSEQEWAKGGESGTANSNSRTLRGVYPIFYGVSATDYSTSGNIYSVLTKLVETEGNKTVQMDGSGFIYYAVPVAWSDENLSSIIDANGFNVTSSFTSYTISVTSTGLTNNYTVDYLIYKLNTTTTVSNANYIFNR
jgi:hypothetical protein